MVKLRNERDESPAVPSVSLDDTQLQRAGVHVHIHNERRALDRAGAGRTASLKLVEAAHELPVQRGLVAQEQAERSAVRDIPRDGACETRGRRRVLVVGPEDTQLGPACPAEPPDRTDHLPHEGSVQLTLGLKLSPQSMREAFQLLRVLSVEEKLPRQAPMPQRVQ